MLVKCLINRHTQECKHCEFPCKLGSPFVWCPPPQTPSTLMDEIDVFMILLPRSGPVALTSRRSTKYVLKSQRERQRLAKLFCLFTDTHITLMPPPPTLESCQARPHPHQSETDPPTWSPRLLVILVSSCLCSYSPQPVPSPWVSPAHGPLPPPCSWGQPSPPTALESFLSCSSWLKCHFPRESFPDSGRGPSRYILFHTLLCPWQHVVLSAIT